MLLWQQAGTQQMPLFTVEKYTGALTAWRTDEGPLEKKAKNQKGFYELNEASSTEWFTVVSKAPVKEGIFRNASSVIH